MRDIPLDGGWINILCSPVNKMPPCITIHWIMVGCTDEVPVVPAHMAMVGIPMYLFISSEKGLENYVPNRSPNINPASPVKSKGNEYLTKETKIEICVSVSARPKPKSQILISVSAGPQFLIYPKIRPKFLIFLKSGRNSLPIQTVGNISI